MEKSDQLPLFDALPASPNPVESVTPQKRKPADTVKIDPPPTLPIGAKWREISTPLQSIGFTLVRSRRRSIGLQITDDGLRVTAPQWIGLRQIDDAVQSKASWIIEKLGHYQSRKERLAFAQTQWRDGGEIPYLGRPIVLSLGESLDKPWQFHGNPLAPEAGNTLGLGLPANAEHFRIRDSVDIWLQGQAKSWFFLRLEDFHSRFGLAPNHWRLSAASTRWGSCSSSGRIMLNWRLVHFEPEIIDYVIAHELAHLSFMDHSRNFWQEVERLCPGFQQARNTLRGHNPASLPLI